MDGGGVVGGGVDRILGVLLFVISEFIVCIVAGA